MVPQINDRWAHAQSLAKQAKNAEAAAKQRRQEATTRLNVAPMDNGFYLTFESWPGFDLKYSTLDPKRKPPELVAVRTTGETEQITEATVYIPEGSLGYFLQKIQEYATQDTASGRPKNSDFVERINRVKLASLRELWTDKASVFPKDGPIWWEVWLRRSDGNEIDRLLDFAVKSGCRLNDQQLTFDERIVVLMWASVTQLSSSIDVLADIAELRSARTYATFFVGLEPFEEAAWVKDLADRVAVADQSSPVVCIFDTGVDRNHILLSGSIAAADTHSYDQNWGAEDQRGHGTEMAGLALYGDLKSALEGSQPITLHHRLESVKILPSQGANDPELYGAIMADSTARVEITKQNPRRVISMAVTAPTSATPGRPTLWSSTIDALAVGRTFDATTKGIAYLDDRSLTGHRLFLVSAGNIRSFDATEDHLQRSELESVEDPAQAWNALAVGAMTHLATVDPNESGFADYRPIAAFGELSPFSRTSVLFKKTWPVKPDVVLEGGNVAHSPNNKTTDTPESLRILTTRAGSHPGRQLTTLTATSAATAQAANLAASIWSKYPSLWPETVRGLLVHSARWTDKMREHFEPASRTERGALLRRYGYGVPTLERCLYSAANASTLIIENTIHPFKNGSLREMCLHSLPWPKDVLAELGATQVQMRITLSYFIEPSPTRIGPEQASRYASHGLRFAVNQSTEREEDFLHRINVAEREEEELRSHGASSSYVDRWYLGPKARNSGSLHSDVWTDTAAALATMSYVAIYPIGGWWKELKNRDRSDAGARYSLLVSLETPAEEIDLWTPVTQQLGIAIKT